MSRLREKPSAYVWAMVCGLPEPFRSRRQLLMLKAYIDDSKMGQPPVYVLGGWVAPPKVWAAFSDEWAEILRMSPRVAYFKLSEALGFNGEFAGMSESSRDEKLKLLVKAVADHELLGISVSIPHDLYAPLFGAHPNAEISNPYMFSFYALVSRLASHFASINYADKIDFVFDYQPTYGAMALVEKGWQSFLKIADPAWRALLNNHPPVFMDDKQIVALQAADLHAGWVRALNSASYQGLEIPRAIWGEDLGNRIHRLYRHIDKDNMYNVYRGACDEYGSPLNARPIAHCLRY